MSPWVPACAGTSGLWRRRNLSAAHSRASGNPEASRTGLGGRGGGRGVLVFLESREDLVSEQREVLDGVRVRHRACVAHHQEISHAAAIFAKIDDLIVDLGGRAAEQDGGID